MKDDFGEQVVERRVVGDLEGQVRLERVKVHDPRGVLEVQLLGGRLALVDGALQREVERLVAVVGGGAGEHVAVVERRAVGDEEAGDVVEAVEAGVVQGLALEVVGWGGRGAELEEQADDGGVAVHGGEEQGRAALLVGQHERRQGLRGGAEEQRLHGAHVAHHRGVVQGGVAQPVQQLAVARRGVRGLAKALRGGVLGLVLQQRVLEKVHVVLRDLIDLKYIHF